MGSRSDWDTMAASADILRQFGVSFECRVVSAHRTPAWMAEYATEAESRGLKVIIAGAGGAAHLPGMIAAQTILPVLGVPVQSKALNGLDSLLSIVQMPSGVPVGTLAIGISGARNAGLLAVRILALNNPMLNQTRLSISGIVKIMDGFSIERRTASSEVSRRPVTLRLVRRPKRLDGSLVAVHKPPELCLMRIRLGLVAIGGLAASTRRCDVWRRSV